MTNYCCKCKNMTWWRKMSWWIFVPIVVSKTFVNDVCYLCTYCPTGYHRCLVVKNILLSSSMVGPRLSFSTSLLRWFFKTWSWVSTGLVRGSGCSIGCKDLLSWTTLIYFKNVCWIPAILQQLSSIFLCWLLIFSNWWRSVTAVRICLQFYVASPCSKSSSN